MRKGVSIFHTYIFFSVSKFRFLARQWDDTLYILPFELYKVSRFARAYVCHLSILKWQQKRFILCYCSRNEQNWWSGRLEHLIAFNSLSFVSCLHTDIRRYIRQQDCAGWKLNVEHPWSFLKKVTSAKLADPTCATIKQYHSKMLLNRPVFFDSFTLRTKLDSRKENVKNTTNIICSKLINSH